jgi:hypothetical protein
VGDGAADVPLEERICIRRPYEGTMRRLYESEAVERDDEDVFVPRSTSKKGRSTLDWDKLSHALLPMSLRLQAITVAIETGADASEPGESVPFRVSMHNRYPIPVVLRTPTPVRWTWALDGVERASHVSPGEPPERATLFSFAGRETKTFERTWSGKIRRTEAEWETPEPGEHTLAAWIDVEDPEGGGLRAETTVELA